MNPSNSQEWIAAANERGADADAVVAARQRSVGAAYLAGFAIECSLKAYLRHRGQGFPTSGRKGHNLKSLWAACGFRMADLNDAAGHKSFFLTDWSTDLRYSAVQENPGLNGGRIRAAKELTGWIQTRIRRRGAS